MDSAQPSQGGGGAAASDTAPTTTTTAPPAAAAAAPPKLSKTKLKQTLWPEPLVVTPLGPAHTHTIILLHGRGSNAEAFGPLLLSAATTTADGKTLQQAFPGAKFVFPTAKKRRCRAFRHVPISQWFDVWSVADPRAKPWLPYEGLRETSEHLQALVQREAAEVGGLGRVVVGGLSQGCAAALLAGLLAFEPPPPPPGEEGGRRLAAVVGMSGWLPFAEELDSRSRGWDAADGEEEEGELDVIFASDDEGEGDGVESGGEGESDEVDGSGTDDGQGEAGRLLKLQMRAANTARDIASLPLLSLRQGQTPAFARTPVFLGHGRHDNRVPVKLGEQARDVLLELGCDVHWKDYDEGHWYKVPEEIDDIVDFLQRVFDGEDHE